MANGTAFHNYENELISYESKFFWFEETGHSVHDLFVDRNVLNPLVTDIDIPSYLREQIETIRAWYRKMQAFEDGQLPGT